MAFPNAEPVLDAVDQHILEALARNARISLKELAQEAGLSSPSAADRLRRLEERGVINAFTVDIDPAAVGYPLQAVVRSMGELDTILDRIAERAETNTSMIKATPVRRRLPPLER